MTCTISGSKHDHKIDLWNNIKWIIGIIMINKLNNIDRKWYISINWLKGDVVIINIITIVIENGDAITTTAISLIITSKYCGIIVI